MKSYMIFLVILLFFQGCQSQNINKDTIYILFDEKNEGMRKQFIPKEKLIIKGDIPIDDSFVYEIQEKKEGLLYEFAYKFSHFNWSEKKSILPKNYSPPLIIEKDYSFLNEIKILKNDFFKSTSYIEVCKTFEERNSWEQNVVIFIIDVSEIKNNKIVLREANFTRPIKE